MTTNHWSDNFPASKATPRSLTADETAALIRDAGKISGKDFVIVDVRREDFEVPPNFSH